MKNRNSYLLCFLAIVLFSTYEIVGKSFGHQIPAVSMTAIRFLIGGLLLLPLGLKEKKVSSIPGHFIVGKVTLVGILNVSISMVLLQLSVAYGKAVLAAIIFSVNPVFVGIFSMFFEKEKISKINILGLSVGLIGLAIIALAERGLFADSSNMLLGIIFGIMSAFFFGIYTVLSKIFVNEIGTYKLNSFAFITGSIVLFFISFILKIDISFELNTMNLLSLAYLGVIITGIGYMVYFTGLKSISTASGAMFFYLKPVIAGMLAYFILGETLNSLQIFGFIVVLFGVNIESIFAFKRK